MSVERVNRLYLLMSIPHHPLPYHVSMQKQSGEYRHHLVTAHWEMRTSEACAEFPDLRVPAHRVQVPHQYLPRHHSIHDHLPMVSYLTVGLMASLELVFLAPVVGLRLSGMIGS